MSLIKSLKKREALLERLTLTMTKSQYERYRELAKTLDSKGLTKLHDLTRERIDLLLNEVEVELSKSS